MELLFRIRSIMLKVKLKRQQANMGERPGSIIISTLPWPCYSPFNGFFCREFADRERILCVVEIESHPDKTHDQLVNILTNIKMKEQVN